MQHHWCLHQASCPKKHQIVSGMSRSHWIWTSSRRLMSFLSNHRVYPTHRLIFRLAHRCWFLEACTMMGPNSSESSSERCLLEVSTIPHFSHVFDELIDECCDFSIVPVGPGSFASGSRKSGRHRLDESSESHPQAMLKGKLRYRIDTNHMYRSYTIYSSAVPHSCLIFKLRCWQNQHVASNSHICFWIFITEQGLIHILSRQFQKSN
jgi:hypothetical protein